MLVLNKKLTSLGILGLTLKRRTLGYIFGLTFKMPMLVFLIFIGHKIYLTFNNTILAHISKAKAIHFEN